MEESQGVITSELREMPTSAGIDKQVSKIRIASHTDRSILISGIFVPFGYGERKFADGIVSLSGWSCVL